MLNDPEWSAKFSNCDIAKIASVSEFLVRSLRPKPAEPSSIKSKIEPTRTVTRGGATYSMHTANIGRAHPGKALLSAKEQRDAPRPSMLTLQALLT